MGKKNPVLIEKLRRENDEFLFWESRHEKLEQEIRQFNKRPHLTPPEDVHRKELQKEKLAAKDKMMEIMRQFDAVR
jgi:uncharacterized protein YdcH (DUF465 family)